MTLASDLVLITDSYGLYKLFTNAKFLTVITYGDIIFFIFNNIADDFIHHINAYPLMLFPPFLIIKSH